LAAGVPVPSPKKAASVQTGSGSATPQIPVSQRLREYRTRAYVISYPENWQPSADANSSELRLVPKEGYLRDADGNTSIGAGAVIDFAQNTGDLRRDTQDLVKQLAAGNAGMRVAEASKNVRVGGQAAMITVLQSKSPFAGETEIDSLITVSRPEGLFFVVLIAPQSAAKNLEDTFNAMIRSIRF
jgi:hypothetical protein